MTNRNEALNQIIMLAGAHHISADEIAAALSRDNASTPEKQTGLLTKLFYYVGGAFVFAGLGLFVAMAWDDISSFSRVLLTFGAGLACFILGCIAARDDAYHKAALPLWLIAALLQPTGLFVFLVEYMDTPGNPAIAAMMIFAMLAVQQFWAYSALKRTSLLFFAFSFWSLLLGTLMVEIDLHDDLVVFLSGISMTGFAWGVSKTSHRAIAPFWFFFGGIQILAGWWALCEDTPAFLSFIIVSIGLIVLSLKTESRTLLFVSIIGLIAYLNYYAWEYFADTLGLPVLIILAGMIMIGLGSYGVKLSKSFGRKGEPA